MKIRLSTILGLLAAGLVATGCSYKSAGTSKLTTLDGTKVDYSNMNKYKKAEICMELQSREDSSLSVFDGAKAAGITKVVYVDESYTGTERCVIVYGE